MKCGKSKMISNERDKGWAWVIAGSAFMASGATFGVWKTLSLFFNDWSQEFKVKDPGKVSFVQAISFAVLTCASPIAGASVRRFGSRPTVILGGILAVLGASLSYGANSLTQLYIYIGGICHFGICLTYLPSFISLGMWMDKRRSLANSVAEMGGPLLAFLLPLVFQLLRDSLGWRKTMLVAAAVYSIIIVSGLLQRPFIQEEVVSACDDSQKTEGSKPIMEKEVKSEMSNVPSVKTQQTGLCERIVFKIKEGMSSLTSQLPGPVVGKILFYMVYCLFQFGGLFALNLFIVPYATEGRGFSEKASSYLLSINAALDLIGRPLAGSILSLRIFAHRRIELIALFMGLYGLVCLMFRFAHSYYFFATLYGAAGLLFGFWNGTYWTVIPDIFGEDLFPLAASCGMMMGGVALLLTAPIAGDIIQTSVGYDGVAFQSAAQLVIAAILLFFLKRNWPCCSIEVNHSDTPELEKDGSYLVGEKLALRLNDGSLQDFASVQILPGPGLPMKRKTYSVVDVAMAMTPATSKLSLQKSSLYLAKKVHSTHSLAIPSTAFSAEKMVKSAANLNSLRP